MLTSLLSFSSTKACLPTRLLKVCAVQGDNSVARSPANIQGWRALQQQLTAFYCCKALHLRCLWGSCLLNSLVIYSESSNFFFRAINQNGSETVILRTTNLRILTGKNHPKIKPQRLRKIRIWTFGLQSSYWQNSALCDRSILQSPYYLS